MARYYLDPEIRITGIIEDSKVGVWLTPHGSGASRELFLGTVKAEQELKICVPAGISNHGEVMIRVRKVGWLPVELRWPDQFGFPLTPEPDPLINICQLEDKNRYYE